MKQPTPLPIDYLECARMDIHGNSVARDGTLFVRLDDVDAVIDTLKAERSRSAPQPQQEYIINEVLINAIGEWHKGPHDINKILSLLRSRPHTPTNPTPTCLCKECKFTTRCGFESAKVNEQNTPTCDDDCTHGRWYISSGDGKLRCDRICIHTIDNFVCPFEQHDTTIRNATLDEFMSAIEFRFDDTNKGRGVVGTIRGIKESLRGGSE